MKQKVLQTLLAMAVAMISLQASAQVKEFEKYADTKDGTYTYISKDMLSLAGKAADFSVPGVNTKSLKNKLSGIQIITSEDKTASVRLKNDTQNIIKQGKYELLMQVDEDGDKVRIYHCEGKKQSVVVMLMEDGREVNVMVFSGTFTLDDVMEMTK